MDNSEYLMWLQSKPYVYNDNPLRVNTKLSTGLFEPLDSGKKLPDFIPVEDSSLIGNIILYVRLIRGNESFKTFIPKVAKVFNVTEESIQIILYNDRESLKLTIPEVTLLKFYLSDKYAKSTITPKEVFERTDSVLNPHKHSYQVDMFSLDDFKTAILDYCKEKIGKTQKK